MPRTKFFMIAIALIITCTSVQAQDDKPIQRERVGVEATDALPLSLNEAIRLALENNNDVQRRPDGVSASGSKFFTRTSWHLSHSQLSWST